MNKFALADFTDAIEVLLRNPKLKSVTVFQAPLANTKQRVRASRKAKTTDQILITFGKPNYAEREYLKQCKKTKTAPRRFLFKFTPKKK